MDERKDKVAPFTGAWIEIKIGTGMEFPACVAPFTGAWIEMSLSRYSPACIGCRTLHGCVD